MKHGEVREEYKSLVEIPKRIWQLARTRRRQEEDTEAGKRNKVNGVEG
jgi:hypothetical protein